MSEHPTSVSPAPGLSRRELLGRAAATATLMVSQSMPAFAAAAHRAVQTGTTPANDPCTLVAALEEGPFFVDEKLNRSDIRTDPVSGATSAGTRLDLTFNVARNDGNACAPLTGAFLDVWHCDSAGVYSDESNNGARTKFLRGYQLTDANGVARFTTIYPGWYGGRTVHVHFKLRLFAGASKTYEFTSQVFFDDALTDAIHATGPYSTAGRRDTLNTRDGIFMSLTPSQRSALVLQPVKGPNGYSAVVNLAVRVG